MNDQLNLGDIKLPGSKILDDDEVILVILYTQ